LLWSGGGVRCFVGVNLSSTEEDKERVELLLVAVEEEEARAGGGIYII